jgi:hypothetical protein
MTQFNTRISDQNRIKVTTNLRGANTINSLLNVDMTNLSNGDLLQYNSNTGKWEAVGILGANIMLDGGDF